MRFQRLNRLFWQIQACDRVSVIQAGMDQKMKLITIVALVFLMHLGLPAAASDIEREKRLASQIIDSIMDGEPVFLNSGDHEFLSIYMEADDPQGAVIIMHGRGFHPNWSDVAYPLRTGLTEQGWNTLSLQMPVLDKEAKFYDYLEIIDEAFPRIEAGIDFLKAQGNEKIVLIAHSCSVHMTMAWVDADRMRDIDGFVGIGMGAVDYRQPMKKPFPLQKLDVPVLDVYGGEEYPAVKKGAPDRLAAIRQAGDPRSKQIVVPGANHYFTDEGDALLDVIVPWLQGL
jgi:pimeloyl-ACP methyl ester carboxylesterase